MVNVKTIDNEYVEIDGVKINVKDYNAWSEEGSENRINFRRKTHVAEHLNTWKRYKELWEECMGSMKDKNGNYLSKNEQSDEIKKNRFVNRNLWQKINDAIDEETYKVDEGGNKKVLENGEKNWTKLTGIDLDMDKGDDKLKERVEKNDAWWEKHLPWYKKMISLMEELVANKVETGNERGKPLNDFHDSDRTKEGEKQTELAQYKDKVYQEITNLMNQDPKITDADLEGEDSKLIHHAISKEGVDRIKSKLVTAIEKARNAKKGKRKRGDGEEENDTPNKKLDDREKDAFDILKNSTLDGVEDNKLATGLRELTRMEGEKKYQGEEEIKRGEDELIKRNPELYRETIIAALKERMDDMKVKESDLDEETKKLINGEFNNDMTKFKTVKEKAIKEIGEAGAKSKWTSLFNQAQALLQKAKKNVTEKIKDDIKTVQEQLKSFKSGTNTYLSRLYQSDKPKFDKLERDLSSFSSQTGSPNKTPWGVIIPVSLAVLAAIAAAVVIVRRRKQARKITE